jgi:hypothetical protein
MSFGPTLKSDADSCFAAVLVTVDARGTLSGSKYQHWGARGDQLCLCRGGLKYLG